MFENPQPNVAIVDYTLGNLFSVKHACEQVGMHATITSSTREINKADAVILPGVGAFGDAMASLHRLDLVGLLREVASSAKPLLGICLGTQLLMTESYEFGIHQGLDIIAGTVNRFENPPAGSRKWKVPHIGWNQIAPYERSWSDSLLQETRKNEFMYFVHSYYTRPRDSSLILSVSRYADIEFCSSLQYRNIFACQFHPERSGPQGLQIYRSLCLCLQHKRENHV